MEAGMGWDRCGPMALDGVGVVQCDVVQPEQMKYDSQRPHPLSSENTSARIQNIDQTDPVRFHLTSSYAIFTGVQRSPVLAEPLPCPTFLL